MIITFQELIKEISVRAWNSPCRQDFEGSARIDRMANPSNSGLPSQCVFSPFYRKPDKLINHFGLRHLSLPNPEILSAAELARIVKALVELWIAWNLIPEFPSDTTDKNRYTLLRDYLEREMPIPAIGSIHINFDSCFGSKGEAA